MATSFIESFKGAFFKQKVEAQTDVFVARKMIAKSLVERDLTLESFSIEDLPEGLTVDSILELLKDNGLSLEEFLQPIGTEISNEKNRAILRKKPEHEGERQKHQTVIDKYLEKRRRALEKLDAEAREIDFKTRSLDKQIAACQVAEASIRRNIPPHVQQEIDLLQQQAKRIQAEQKQWQVQIDHAHEQIRGCEREITKFSKPQNHHGAGLPENREIREGHVQRNQEIVAKFNQRLKDYGKEFQKLQSKLDSIRAKQTELRNSVFES